MAWGARHTATLANVTDEKVFDDVPMLADDGVAHCQVAVEFPHDPKDDALVHVYATLDDDPDPVWDTQPFGENLIEKVSGATARISFTVSGVYRFRVGVRSAGTLTSADFSYRLTRQPLQQSR